MKKFNKVGQAFAIIAAIIVVFSAGITTANAFQNIAATEINTVDVTQVYQLSYGNRIYKDVDGNVISYEEYCEYVNGEKITLYMGATDEIPTGIADLSEVTTEELSLNDYTGKYTTDTIIAGHGSGKDAVAQYVVFAVPDNYEVTFWTVPTLDALGIGMPFTEVSADGYNIYYLNSASYDIEDGGISYVIYFSLGE